MVLCYLFTVIDGLILTVEYDPSPITLPNMKSSGFFLTWPGGLVSLPEDILSPAAPAIPTGGVAEVGLSGGLVSSLPRRGLNQTAILSNGVARGSQ